MSFLNDLLSGQAFPTKGFVEFCSNDHIRYQNGIDVSGHNYNCHRRIRIENSITGNEGYTVTIFNEDGVHPLWGNNVQMSPKQMRIVKQKDDCIELRGYGTDAMGFPFDNYGMSVYHDGNQIMKCVLHMFDRKTDLEYLQV